MIAPGRGRLDERADARPQRRRGARRRGARQRRADRVARLRRASTEHRPSPSRVCTSCRRSSRPARQGRWTSSSTPGGVAGRAARAARQRLLPPDLVGVLGRTEGLSLVKLTLNEDPFTENATKAIPQLRAPRREPVDPKALVGGPTAEIYDNEHLPQPGRQADRPARAGAGRRDRRGRAAEPDRAGLRRRHGGAVVRVRARRERAGLRASPIPPSRCSRSCSWSRSAWTTTSS